ncbi:MAG TPA: hypothetical protein VLX92_23445 [Kofleriaceae bacterium]|nr:hypothetical protein [Kofleriaceae bacterium]
MRALVVTSIAVLSLALFARPACADDPNRVFAGQIITMTKRPPASAKSPGAYIATMRKLKQVNFMEDKTDHSWTVYFVAFLKSPLDDVEYAIKFYELSGRSQQLLATSDQFTDSRGEKTINSKIKLDKEQMGVNKELLMTLENKGRVLASARFRILGEGDKFTGKVNFSQDDANDDDDKAKQK